MRTDRRARCVPKSEYGQVADACTLCDMCFMTKCPYVPPHEFNVDFPHLMLRYRAVEQKEGKAPRPRAARQDRPQRRARRGRSRRSPTGRSDKHNKLTRPVLEKIAGIDRHAALPKYHGRTFVMRAKRNPPARDASRARRRSARRCSTPPVSSTTTTPRSARRPAPCSRRTASRPRPSIPQCCGMPQLEAGDLAEVAKPRARSPPSSAPGSTRAMTSSPSSRPAR